MDIDDLVAVVCKNREGEVCVLPVLDVPNLEVDLNEGTWKYDSLGANIGDYDTPLLDDPKGVFGVYDRTDNDHLAAMVKDYAMMSSTPHITAIR